MSSKAVVKRHVDPDIFKNFIKERGVSIRQLGSLCETNERTIRRMLQDEEVTLNIGLDLCTYLDCSFDQLFGRDESPEWRNSMVTILKKVR